MALDVMGFIATQWATNRFQFVLLAGNFFLWGAVIILGTIAYLWAKSKQ